jgi:amino-acid N-acetyltransferase
MKAKQTRIVIRKAGLRDVPAIHKLIKANAVKDLMLPRSANYIGEKIRDYSVATVDGSVAGVCALRVSWDGPPELVSLAVAPKAGGKGLGKRLVRSCLREAKELGAKQVFALTKVEDFFYGLGFGPKNRDELPRKIWTECVNCPRFPDCDEQAVIINLDKK